MTVIVGLYVLFEALSIVFCLNYLYGEKPRLDVVTVCYVLVDVGLMEAIYYMQLGNIGSLIIYPVIVLYCGFKFGFHFKPILINNILHMAILSSIQATIMLLFSVLFKIQKTDIFDDLFINIFIFIIISMGLRKINLKKLSDVLQSDEKLIIFSMAVVIISTVLFLFTYKWNRSFEILYYAVLGISIVLIIVAVVDIGKHKIKAKEAEAELRLHKLYEASFRNLIDDICAKQHEFDNHINTIYSQHYLYKTYDELVEAQRKYCGEIMNENHYNKLLSKGNPVILSFLYSKFLELEKEGIRATYKINIGDLESGVPVYKTVELLGNLIKNAVEAVKERGNDGIHVMMLEEKDRIQIEVSNESERIDLKRIQEFFKKGYSEKGKNRGYGLYNVKKICENYDIELSCENRDGEDGNWLVFGLNINKTL